MNITFLASANSIHTLRWTTYFKNKGHQISIISLKKPAFAYKGIAVFVLKRLTNRAGFISHIINFLPFVYQIVKLRRQINPDVIHAIGSSNGLLASASNCESFIFTIADPDLNSILNKYPIKKANWLVCDGENVKQAMLKLGANENKIKIIRFGVNLKRFKPRKVLRSPELIISTKPLREESDVATLIKAIPLIVKEIPKARFFIVGDGDQKENLIRLAKELKVSGYVKFVGNVSEDEISLYLNSCGIFVNTSLTDTGLASSTTEAMACVLPVVVSDVGDNKLWIDDRFIFPIRDYYSLAEKVIYIFNQDIIRNYNRNAIAEHFNYKTEMNKMLALYLNYDK